MLGRGGGVWEEEEGGRAELCGFAGAQRGGAARGREGRAGPGAALEAAGAAGGGGSLPMLRESAGKKVPFVLKVSYRGDFASRLQGEGVRSRGTHLSAARLVLRCCSLISVSPEATVRPT